MSKTTDAANGVVAVLQSAGYSDVKLEYTPNFEMASDIVSALFVTPTQYGTAEDRNRVSRRVKTEITLIVKIKEGEKDAYFEKYNDQMEAISELFYLKQLPNLAGITCDGFEIDVMGSDLRYRETGQYLGHIVLEFITI
jgi:hypothetical protein